MDIKDSGNKIIETYEYYFNILNVILSEMSNVTLKDVRDVLDELEIELEKLQK